MRASFVTWVLALGLAFGPGTFVAGSPQPAPARAEAAPALFDAELRFSPQAVSLPDAAPERVIVAKLQAGEPQWAADFASSALYELDAGDATGEPGRALQRGRLLWLRARALEELERLPEAEAALETLAAADHPLAPWAQLRLGALCMRHDAEAAVTILAPLLHDFPEADRAEQLYAIALARTERREEALVRLRALVAAAPAHVAAATVAMPLAELLDKRGLPEDKLEALSLYRRVATRAPTTAVGRHAQRQADALVRSLPPKLRTAHREPRVEDAFALGTALLNDREYESAERHFEQLAQRVRDDRGLACKAQLERGRALLRKRQRKEGAELMSKLAGDCRDPDVTAWARYYAGRALLRLDQPQAALAHYDALPVETPGHRLADDGLFQGALAAADADDEAGMFARLQKLVSDHPEGDMRPDGLFLLAWQARKDKRHVEALGYFDTLLRDGTGENEEGIFGRTAYWRARTLTALGRKPEAIDGYRAVIHDYPLSYYAQQALQRLQELSPREAKRQRAWLEMGKPQPDGALTFPHRGEMDTPAFLGAIALLQVGELERAEAALAALGPRSDDELMWLTAALYDATGAYAKASAMSRYRLRAFMQTPPIGEARARWRIAYPEAYAPLIEEAAAEAGVPASFLRAVAREESAFNPEAVSSARAYGLIQLMRPTAREHARVLGLPSTPAALKRPEINLRIGAHFIRFLWKRYADNPAVVPAAYNAGHGAAGRWMRATPDMPLDEWIEGIPYGETRRYSRRVLQSYGIYTFLDTGKLPPLPRTLPAR